MKASLSLTAALWLGLFSISACSQQQAQEAQQDANQEESQAFDAEVFMEEYRSLLMQREFDEAEQKFKQALEKNPDSAQLRSLHPLAYNYLRRAGRHEEAFGHLKAVVDRQLDMTAEAGRGSESFAQYLNMLTDMAEQLGGTDRALALLDEYQKRAKELGGESGELARSIESQRAIQLAKAGRTDEAKAIIDEQVAATEEKLQQNPDDADAILAKASALNSRVRLALAAEGSDADKAWAELLDFTATQANEHTDSPEVVQRFVTDHISRAAQLARSEPDQADAVLKKIEDFSTAATGAQGDEAADDAPAGLDVLRGYQSSIRRLRDQIEQSRKMLALIGSPAVYPENVDGWVNGEPLTPESLKGKVVLLDFFAVWCGPCIATFPHLREWHEEYADQGLTIIGVTNYYQYGWDEEAGRSKRESDLEPEAERAAMEHFVKHHELRHPIAFVNDRELQQHYLVSGIPHAVVIDRQGKVRLFRIGSGEANAADLKKAIDESLAESAPAG